jgi:hypothetical protein
MSDHDAASVVAQMAGLDRGDPKRFVTPTQLIGRFCDESLSGDLVAWAGTRQEDGMTVSKGFCGFMGGRGDGLVTGFDDGYSFMGYLGERGWSALAAKGDWPYVVYLAFVPKTPYAIAGYCEGDLTVWQFPDGERAREFYRDLKDCP